MTACPAVKRIIITSTTPLSIITNISKVAHELKMVLCSTCTPGQWSRVHGLLNQLDVTPQSLEVPRLGCGSQLVVCSLG